ncbi:MAG TPA: hypothetical protein VG938_03820 [Verrucomicrobiae bacterium]|jgi:hypothetical protein|nr:hypothetical protein [Verrucomicrobiae bacterium]
MSRLTLAWAMHLAQRSLEILNLALIIDLLPFGEFERFEHFLHLIERVFEFLDDSVHLLDGVSDGGSLMRGFRVLWRLILVVLLGFFGSGGKRFGSGVRGNGFARRWRQRFARLATPGMAATAASGTTAASWGCGIGLCGGAFF